MQSAKTRLIFQAAVDIFSEHGFEKATMDEIAARANVAKGTIYYHFKSKEDLFLFLVEEGTELLRDTVLSHVSDDASATEKVRTIIQGQLAFFKEYRDFCIIILREAWGEATRQREFRRMLVHYVNVIQNILEEGMQAGEFMPTNAESTAWSIFGAMSLTALHHILANPAFDPLTLSPYIESLVLHGLRIPQTAEES